MTSTRISGRNARVETKGMVPVLILLALLVGFGLPCAVFSQQVELDLDRNIAGIQSSVDLDPANPLLLQGSLVATNCTNAGRYSVRMLVTSSAGGDAITCPATFAAGDVADAGPAPVCDVAATPDELGRANLFASAVPANGGNVVFFNFDVTLIGSDGDTITFDYRASSTPGGSTLGVNVNGTNFTFGPNSSNPIPTVGATVNIRPDTDTVCLRCVDAGYYILDGLGGRHPVGSVPVISGPVYFGIDIAKDMELAGPFIGVVTDILVLDEFGGASLVANAGSTPSQVFNFPDGTSEAVDVVLSDDGAGFWVLRADGGIYAAGSTLPGGADGSQPVAETAVALDFPFGGAVPRNTNPLTPASDPDASVRAVGFVVVQSADPKATTGIVVLDSQGGHYILTGSGSTALDDDVANSILNGPGGTSETVYPFWQGLDIGRDIELHPNGGASDGVGIYDGFGGVHPVPVNNAGSGVQFLRNDGTTPVPASGVGLPYLTLGFDDPATAGSDESDPNAGFGIDSHSIFKDLEFCTLTGTPGAKGDAQGCGGVYVLDGFGGVFVLGNTRIAGANVPTPAFSNGPYFFPNPIVRDLEPANQVLVTGFAE